MTLTTTTDYTLPEALVQLVTADEAELIAKAAGTINAAWSRTLKATAVVLVDLKSKIGHGSWIAFLNSGVLPLSERDARDLVAAATWLDGTQLPEEILQRLGKRTLAIIGGADEDVQQELEERLLNGETITETAARTAVSGETKPKKKTVKELEAELEELKNQLAAVELDKYKKAAELDYIRDTTDRLYDPYRFQALIVQIIGGHSDLLPNSEKVALILKIAKALGADGRTKGGRQLAAGFRAVFGEDEQLELDGQLQLPAPRLAG